MNKRELNSILAAILIFSVVAATSFIIQGLWNEILLIFLFSSIIILSSVAAKKTMAYLLDADVEHELWKMNRYGLKESAHFRTLIPTGIIIPLLTSVVSLGFLKIPTILTFEARARLSRASKRFGHYSYSEMTDWHNALIGVAGIIAALLVTIISYIFDYEYLAKLASIYAFFSIIPFSNLDGTQIFFGSKTLWTAVAVICLIFIGYALFLN